MDDNTIEYFTVYDGPQTGPPPPSPGTLAREIRDYLRASEIVDTPSVPALFESNLAHRDKLRDVASRLTGMTAPPNRNVVQEYEALVSDLRDKLADARYENTRLREQLDQPSATQPEDDICRMWMEHPLFDDVWCFAEGHDDCIRMLDRHLMGKDQNAFTTTGPLAPWRNVPPGADVSFFQYVAELKGVAVDWVRQSSSNGVFRVLVRYENDSYSSFYWRAKPCT